MQDGEPGTAESNRPVVIGGDAGLMEPGAVDLLLASIFSDESFRAFLRGQIHQQELNLADQSALIRILHDFFRNNLGWEQPVLRENLAGAVAELARHQSETISGALAYSSNSRAAGELVFWPNPTREGGAALTQSSPEGAKTPIVGKGTVIGSAGSCFAYEIARTLQEWGFNYLVAEKEHDGSNGIIVDAYDPSSSLVRFNATWGLIFSTPSLRQLVERAFDIRHPPKIVVREETKAGKEFYTDPFREGVAFESPEAFQADYDRHTAACRTVFETVEVFIVTLGLNECWALKSEGSVLSNLPRRTEIHSLVRPRQLSVSENVHELQRFLDTVRQFNPDFKLIVSLSPVPLMATFRQDQNVIAANAHSKAVLRVAADEFVGGNEGVYYFPSYEYVMHCAPDAWEADERHVTRETVASIMQMFRRTFVADD